MIIYSIVLLVIITAFSTIFHYIMEYEGQHYSWVTGFYWTLTVMSTLGFGDITFNSDIGRLFSMVTLLTGIILLLVLLPFTFIQFFYAPWIEAQNKTRSPQELPQSVKDHVIFTSFNDITRSLIEKLNNYGIDYIIIMSELNKALELYDTGYKVGYGLIDNPDTYEKMRVKNAALVFASNSDEMNTNIAFTIRELTSGVPIVTTADSFDSVDILNLAGSDLVLEPRKMIGEAFGRRTLGGSSVAGIIGKFENLVIAEAPAIGTPMVGKALPELQLRQKMGINVAGFWENGVFKEANPDYVINKSTVMVLIGEKESIDMYNETFVIFQADPKPVIIVGAGRVGKYTAGSLEKRGIDYVLIEKETERNFVPGKTITGNAADFNVLKKAGIDEAPTVIISTNNDDINIYLTIYCRRLRPDIQIISRANSDANVTTLSRAGADLILSYPTLMANAVYNFLRQNKILMLSEGIDIFSMKTTEKLLGKNLINSKIRENTNCNVIALKKDDKIFANPDPHINFDEDTILLLIGTKEAEAKFIKMYT